MNDDPALTALRHRLTKARESLGGEHMTIPASEIFARDKRHRARRWLAAGGAACSATGLAVALTLAPGSSARPGQVQLAAWTVRTNPDGTVTFTLRNTSHPALLQQTLAKAGVPAVVRWGKICQAGGQGQRLMSTEGFVKASAAPGVASYFAMMGGGSGASPDLGWSWTVTPGKIPRGGQFVISAMPGRVPANDIQAMWEFAHTSAPITCARLMKP
jgi:hypothetical protein